MTLEECESFLMEYTDVCTPHAMLKGIDYYIKYSRSYRLLVGFSLITVLPGGIFLQVAYYENFVDKQCEPIGISRKFNIAEINKANLIELMMPVIREDKENRVDRFLCRAYTGRDIADAIQFNCDKIANWNTLTQERRDLISELREMLEQV